MIVTITYKFVLVAIGVGIAVFGRGFLHQYLEGILPVFYLGLATEYLLCYFYDSACVSSGSCQKLSGKGTQNTGKTAPSPQKRKQA